MKLQFGDISHLHPK